MGISGIVNARQRQCLACASITGIYGGAFHILNNLTMFSIGSMGVIAAGAIFPVIASVAFCVFILEKVGLQRFQYFFTSVISIAWLLGLLHTSTTEIPLLKELWLSSNNFQRLLFFSVIPGAIGGWIFRKNILKLTTILLIMLLAAVLMNFSQMSSRVQENSLFVPRQTETTPLWFNPAVKSNIYFVLSDGLTSFSYLKNIGMDTGIHTDYLERNSFKVYEDFYSNIHPTLLSMASMLNFRLVSDANPEWARSAIADPKELKYNLSKSNYTLEYFHMADYLLLRGCGVDTCYPQLDSFRQAGAMLSRIKGKRLIKDNWKFNVDDEVLLGEIKDSIKSQKKPSFRYIHSYYPAHTDHAVRNVCNEREEKRLYVNRVENEFVRLRDTIDAIVELDPSAVIILTADHGPWIEDRCTWDGVPTTLKGLQDRLGSVLAIRWPQHYNGEFDKAIFSNVNLIKYVMFSLNNATGLPPSLEKENLYVLDKGIPTVVVENGDLNTIDR